MVGGLQGEEWKFIQKYLKKRSKRVGAQISQFARRFRTMHGDLRKSRKLISQLGIHFRTLSSKFASCKITFACWSSKFARCEFVLQLDVVVLRRPYLPHFSSNSYTAWSVRFLTSWDLKWYITCRKWTSRSAPKLQNKTAAAVLYFLHSVFPLSVVLSLHTLKEFGKGLWSSKAWFFMNLSSQKLCHEIYTSLPHSWIALV